MFQRPKAIEVLLRNQAFVVKRFGEVDGPAQDTLKKGQVTWKKFPSVLDAWKEAISRSGFLV